MSTPRAKSRAPRLMPTPKTLQKALEKSAQQAQRLADAFGLKVPTVPAMPPLAREQG